MQCSVVYYTRALTRYYLNLTSRKSVVFFLLTRGRMSNTIITATTKLVRDHYIIGYYDVYRERNVDRYHRRRI